MIIKNQEDVTTAVLEAYKTIDNPRLREIVASLVKHLHAFARDVHLTEDEFRQATEIIAKMGQMTNATHNEVVLMSGSLGFSSLICLLKFNTLISQIYVNDDEKLDSDVQFGVTRALIGDYVRHNGAAPVADVTGEWYSLDQTFVMEPGKSRLPKAPIE